MIKKNGFVLLEVLIASAIGAFIMMALYQVLSQTNLSVVMMERISSIDMRQLLVQNQLEHDLSGAFIITVTVPAGAPSTGLSNVRTGTGANPASPATTPKLKKGFYSKNNGDNLEILTFITSNPLRSFSKYSSTEKPKPLIARVVYKLVLDQQPRGAKAGEKVSFKLFRQESEFLGFDEFEKRKPISYEVAKNIKKMSVEYTVAIKPTPPSTPSPTTPPGPGSPTAPATPVSKPTYKNFKIWTEKEIESTKKEKPDFFKFVIEFWDDSKKTYKTMENKQQVGLQTNIDLDVSVGINKNTNNGANKSNNKGVSNTNNGANKNNRRKPSIFDAFLTGKR